MERSNLRDPRDVLASLPKPKRKQDKKNKNRKYGRNCRWGIGPDGKAITHSITKYRASGNRERNKARRIAREARKKGRKIAA